MTVLFVLGICICCIIAFAIMTEDRNRKAARRAATIVVMLVVLVVAVTIAFSVARKDDGTMDTKNVQRLVDDTDEPETDDAGFTNLAAFLTE